MFRQTYGIRLAAIGDGSLLGADDVRIRFGDDSDCSPIGFGKRHFVGTLRGTGALISTA